MRKKHLIYILTVAALLFGISLFVFIGRFLSNSSDEENTRQTVTNVISPSGIESTVQVKLPPTSYEIPSASHVSQSFNNCGPAALSMAMSYFGINVSQEELRERMRPFNNPAGGIDDKSVFAPEFIEHAQEYGLMGLERPNGTDELIKTFIANDIPVVLRTWLHPNEDIGHFRIVRGYDENRRVFIQDDSYEGRNLEYSYDVFNEMWKPFNYGYIVIFSEEKKELVYKIVGEEVDKLTAYKNAVSRAENNLDNNPDSAFDLFNLSNSHYHLGEFAKSVEYYERAQSIGLPPRMMWYQLEPLKAYLEIGDHERVFSLTDWIMQNNNIAFSELYILRGKSYQSQGNISSARAEFEKAVYYNQNLTIAKEALESL